MASRQIDPGRTPSGDLERLVNRDTSDNRLKQCHALLALISTRLELGSALSAADRAAILRKVLLRVADKARDQAAIEVHFGQAGKNSNCQAAAAAELLRLTSDESQQLFLKVAEKVCGTENWKTLSNLKENQGADERYFRAAIWTHTTHRKTGKRNMKAWLEAFVAVTERYIEDADFRDEILVYARTLPTWRDTAKTGPRHDTLETTREAATIRPFAADIPQPDDLELRDVIHRFAHRMRTRLQDEQGHRTKDKDYLIPTRLLPASEQCSDRIENIQGAGGLPIDLTSTVDHILDIFTSIRSGRLVILGKSGAGKTTLAIKLALAVLAARPPNEAVPAVFDLGHWNPKQSLDAWMVERLGIDHDELKRTSKGKPSLAQQLVDGDHIFPVLDGFDEITPSKRVDAIRSINSWLGRRGHRLVMTSWPDAYYEAVSQSGVVLSRSLAIQIDDLELRDIKKYLEYSTHLPEKWTEVISCMEAAHTDPRGAQLLEVFSTPLMLFLARSIYSDSPTSPHELIDSSFPDSVSIRHHLLEQFVPAVYQRPPGKDDSPVYPVERVQKWLGFLATSLVAEDEADFRWWKATEELFQKRLYVLIGVFSTPLLAFALLTFARLWTHGFAPSILWTAAIICVVLSALAMFLLTILAGAEMQPKRLHWKSVIDYHRQSRGDELAFIRLIMPLGNYVSFMFLVVTIVAWGSGFTWMSGSMPEVPAVLGMFIALIAFFLFTTSVLTVTPPENLSEAISPQSLLRADRKAAVMRVAVCVGPLFLISFTFWLAGSYTFWPTSAGVLSAAILMGICSASAAWLAGRIFLALGGMMPWRCMQFLAGARARGVLRQAGGAYQFRHTQLRDHLAMQFMKKEDGEFRKNSKMILRARRNLASAQFAAGALDTADVELRDILALQQRGSDRYGALETWFALIQVLMDKDQTADALDEVQSMRRQNTDFVVGGIEGAHYAGRLILVELLTRQERHAEAEEEYLALRRLVEVDRKNTGRLGRVAEELWENLDETYEVND